MVSCGTDQHNFLGDDGDQAWPFEGRGFRQFWVIRRGANGKYGICGNDESVTY